MGNQAVVQSVVVAQSALDPSQTVQKLALFNEDGETLEVTDLAAGVTGADIVLTGYEAVTGDDLAATDTVNAALAKLEARVAALESPS